MSLSSKKQVEAIRKLTHGLVDRETIRDLIEELGFDAACEEALRYFVKVAPLEIVKLEEATATVRAFNDRFRALTTG